MSSSSGPPSSHPRRRTTEAPRSARGCARPSSSLAGPRRAATARNGLSPPPPPSPADDDSFGQLPAPPGTRRDIFRYAPRGSTLELVDPPVTFGHDVPTTIRSLKAGHAARLARVVDQCAYQQSLRERAFPYQARDALLTSTLGSTTATLQPADAAGRRRRDVGTAAVAPLSAAQARRLGRRVERRVTPGAVLAQAVLLEQLDVFERCGGCGGRPADEDRGCAFGRTQRDGLASVLRGTVAGVLARDRAGFAESVLRGAHGRAAAAAPAWDGGAGVAASESDDDDDDDRGAGFDVAAAAAAAARRDRGAGGGGGVRDAASPYASLCVRVLFAVQSFAAEEAQQGLSAHEARCVAAVVRGMPGDTHAVRRRGVLAASLKGRLAKVCDDCGSVGTRKVDGLAACARSLDVQGEGYLSLPGLLRAVEYGVWRRRAAALHEGEAGLGAGFCLCAAVFALLRHYDAALCPADVAIVAKQALGSGWAAAAAAPQAAAALQEPAATAARAARELAALRRFLVEEARRCKQDEVEYAAYEGFIRGGSCPLLDSMLGAPEKGAPRGAG